MPYRIDDKVQLENHLRSHWPEHYYLGELESRGMLIRLDNVDVDAEQLILRTFQCDTAWCLRCTGEGRDKHYKGSCCTDLQVDITAAERDALQALGREACERLQFPPNDPLGAVARRLERGEFTDESDYGELIMRHQSNHRCALSWMDRGGHRCAINSLCERLGKPLPGLKPDPCFLFPLHYVEYVPGRLFITVMSMENYKYIGADKVVGNLRCLRRPQPGAPPAYRSLQYEIIYCLGESFYAELERAASTFAPPGQPA